MLFFGNLDSRVDRRLLYEIGVQAGPVASVNVPTDPVFGKNKGYGFIVRSETKTLCQDLLSTGITGLLHQP
jgi:splicing factor 3B subunit 4